MMHLSAEKGSPFYDADLLARKPVVFLNGQRIDRVVEADEDGGRVVVYETDSEDRPVILYDDAKTGAVVRTADVVAQDYFPDGSDRYVNPRAATRELRGVVRIELTVAA